MSKYDALRDHLRKQTLAEFELTFGEIEKLTGYPLPKSAERPQWWANVRNTGTHVQRDAWRAAGYDAFLVSGSRKVRFRRTRLAHSPVAPSADHLTGTGEAGTSRSEAHMAIEDDNIAILRDAYRRWAEGKGLDRDGWMAVMDEAISLRSIGQGADGVEFSSARRGRSGVLDYLEHLTRDWEMISYEMNEYVAQGDRVVAIGRCAWRNKRTGKVAETRKVDIWRFRDGRAVEFEELFDTAAAMAPAQP